MKQTVVKYQNLADGKIKIVAIKNAATKEQIIEEFGSEVWRVYDSEGPKYFTNSSEYLYHTANDCGEPIKNIMAGDVLKESAFEALVGSLKRSAQRLIEIRKQVAAYEVKEIVI